ARCRRPVKGSFRPRGRPVTMKKGPLPGPEWNWRTNDAAQRRLPGAAAGKGGETALGRCPNTGGGGRGGGGADPAPGGGGGGMLAVGGGGVSERRLRSAFRRSSKSTSLISESASASRSSTA